MRLTAFGDEITLWWHWFLCRRQFEWACQEDTADGRERRNAEFFSHRRPLVLLTNIFIGMAVSIPLIIITFCAKKNGQ